MPATPLLNLF